MNCSSCGRRTVVQNRREFLAKSALGFGALALGDLLTREAARAGTIPAGPNLLAPKKPPLPATAKNVILLFMQGGPSHMDTFDPKPELNRRDGEPLPDSFKADDLSLQFIKATDAKLMGSAFPFKKYGQSGLEVSDLFQNVARYADDMAIVRSCYHDSFIHGPALNMLLSGTMLTGHPSFGSWVLYGLGSESENLPAYIVMSDAALRISSAAYGSGFLPVIYQGTLVRPEGAPILNLTSPFDAKSQRILLDQINHWNQRHLEYSPDSLPLSARLANLELAFRMPTAEPELIDIT